MLSFSPRRTELQAFRNFQQPGLASAAVPSVALHKISLYA